MLLLVKVVVTKKSSVIVNMSAPLAVKKYDFKCQVLLDVYSDLW